MWSQLIEHSVKRWLGVLYFMVGRTNIRQFVLKPGKSFELGHHLLERRGLATQLYGLNMRLIVWNPRPNVDHAGGRDIVAADESNFAHLPFRFIGFGAFLPSTTLRIIALMPLGFT
jgi:hypothetical protein